MLQGKTTDEGELEGRWREKSKGTIEDEWGVRWKKGRVDEDREDGGGIERQWKRIRENIWEKYGYTCQQAIQDVSIV